MKRGDAVFFAFGCAGWVMVLLDLFDVVPLAGTLDLAFYPLYAAAGFLGSVSGNVLACRWSRAAAADRRPLLLGYLAAPVGWVALLRALAPAASQQAAPLVGLWAALVYGVFFTVPLVVRRPGPPPSRTR